METGPTWLPEQSRLHSSPSGGLRLRGRDKPSGWFSGALINCEAGRSLRGQIKPALRSKPGWSQRLCGLNFRVVWTSSLGCAGAVYSRFQTAVQRGQRPRTPQATPETRERGGLFSPSASSYRLGGRRPGAPRPCPCCRRRRGCRRFAKRSLARGRRDLRAGEWRRRRFDSLPRLPN